MLTRFTSQLLHINTKGYSTVIYCSNGYYNTRFKVEAEDSYHT